MSGSIAESIKKYVKKHTKPVLTYKQGTPQVQLKEWLAEALELGDDRVASAKLTSAGLVPKSSGTARIYVYAYPTHTKPMAVKSRSPGSDVDEVG